MNGPPPILEVSRSYDGYVLITDATSPLGLRWRLSVVASLCLIEAIFSDFVHRRPVCRGTVETVGGTRVTFEWPRERVEYAVIDLSHNAGLCLSPLTGEVT